MNPTSPFQFMWVIHDHGLPYQKSYRLQVYENHFRKMMVLLDCRVKNGRGIAQQFNAENGRN